MFIQIFVFKKKYTCNADNLDFVSAYNDIKHDKGCDDKSRDSSLKDTKDKKDISKIDKHVKNDGIEFPFATNTFAVHCNGKREKKEKAEEYRVEDPKEE